MNTIEKLKHARRVSAPLVSITTADQQHTMQTIKTALNENTSIVRWDYLTGTNPVNELGKAVADLTGRGDDDNTIANPANLLNLAKTFPEETVVFVLNFDQFLADKDQPAVLQGVANLRDVFKQDRRMLIMLSPGISIPAALKDDIISIDEELPSEEELKQIVIEQDKSASDGTERTLLDEQTVERAVEAVQGLSSFSAEQTIAMSLRKEGIDLDHCWQQKKVQIEQTKGLSIYRGGETFKDIGGLDQIKSYLSRVMTGRKPPKTIVWIDEIEKTGISSRNDTSGVNQDQEGTLLSYMEDQDVFGVMLLGVPGCGKSAICKAVGAEFDRVVIRLDLGAMMGSLVGQSQQQIRQALKVVSAVGGKDTLWLATSNSINGLSAAMRSRFTDIFFFDLPTKEERKPIWDVWLKKYSLESDLSTTFGDGWVGRNIRQCVTKAWMMNMSVEEASEYIIPVGSVEREEIERLRKQADGRYLNASGKGVYRIENKAGKRSIDL